jgi:hypothetical protein
MNAEALEGEGDMESLQPATVDDRVPAFSFKEQRSTRR